MPSTDLTVRLLSSIWQVEATAWDALAGDDDPLIEHAFLALLEDSGSVGGGSGWTPHHVTVWRGGTLCAALPLYVKDHSYGEFIFDWAWANASAQLGVPYYPKLVSMVPLTPTTGRRLLLSAADDPHVLARAVVEGVFQAAEATGASSIHLLFLREEERRLLGADTRLRPRLSHQFHFENAGYATFDDFTGRFRSALRKQVRKERAAVADAQYDIRVLTGADATEADVEAMRHFYVDTCERHGSPTYLKPGFFRELLCRVGSRTLLVMAYRDGVPVAGSLNFEKGRGIYGRYWGCADESENLHFELCYYRLIERAIERGCTRFEAGAQGIHKLRRGLLPAPIHSLHWVRDPHLARAVHEFLPREAFAAQAEMDELARHGPFRRETEAG